MRVSLPFLTLLAASLFVACERMPGITDSQEVQVFFNYTLDASVGNSMTKTSNSVIFNQFYQKITTAELVAPNYELTFVEVNTGLKYVFVGSWAAQHLITIRTGRYHVTGKSTAAGGSIQDKCSIYFDETLNINSSDTNITLSALYDCYLLIFNNLNVTSLKNIDGSTEEDFFDFGATYKYAFVNNSLYSTANKETAHILGTFSSTAYFKVFTGNLSFAKGKYYVYNSITGSFNIPEMEDGESSSDPGNLSAAGTANSYIVPAAGHYRFNAAVKGNSTQSVGTIASAEVLWETFNTTTAPTVGDLISNVSVNNGIVSFDASAATGNALIAVKNAGGDILWSWHIWLTDYDPNTDYDVYVDHPGVKVMDRNLGAMSSTPGIQSFGLIYEWGRKDPFMGSASLSSFSAFAATNTHEQVTTSAAYGTIEYATQHPMTYIIATSQGLDWLQTHDDTAWASEKTIYDPCPPGWRVPDGGENGIWSGFDISSKTTWTFDSTNKGMTFGSAFATPDVWMPAQGYHGDSSTYYSGWWQHGVEGRYWTTRTMSGQYADYFDFTSSGSVPYHASGWSTHNSRANGMPVRCCKQ